MKTKQACKDLKISYYTGQRIIQKYRREGRIVDSHPGSKPIELDIKKMLIEKVIEQKMTIQQACRDLNIPYHIGKKTIKIYRREETTIDERLFEVDINYIAGQ